MCITAPARITDVDGDVAVVEVGGRSRRALLLPTPDAGIGDWVLVGAGSVLRRLTAAEARALSRTIDAAAAATPAEPPGGRR